MELNIKKAREDAGLSQKQVALELGVSAPTASDWEAGKIFPTAKNLIALAKLLNVSTDYLLGVSPTKTPVNALQTPIESFLMRRFRTNSENTLCLLAEMSNDDIDMLLMPSTDVPATPYSRLKRARLASALTKKTLAEKLGISLKEYEAFEEGRQPIPNELFSRITSILDNVDPKWLGCCIEYRDPLTGQFCDPGKYKPLVDAVYDPMDLKEEKRAFLSDISIELSHLLSLLENPQIAELFSKLDCSDRAEIKGEMKQMLKGKKYSSEDASSPPTQSDMAV